MKKLVENYDKKTVLPHEFTREPAVQDRVKLLESCKAQFSPIMSLYRDASHTLRPLLTKVMTNTPDLEVKDSIQGQICFWVISELEALILSLITWKPQKVQNLESSGIDFLQLLQFIIFLR